jgi:DNA end-binding protein Ku
MAHAIWNGTINFGLVTIPVKLFTAVRENELHFNQLHAKDKGRIRYQRVCESCAKEVTWDEIVKGYEYEKGDYVVLSDEDLKQANVEATQSIDIVQFVDLDEIDPMYFEKPYYLEPEKKGRHAYALLRDALAKSNKVGIARVVIRTREHLAALKPNGDALVLEIMHFADELVEIGDFNIPDRKEAPAANEMKAAQMLIGTMSAKFEPEEFRDKYRDDVLEMIEARAKGQPQKRAAKKAPASSKVVNLMDVLQQSLAERKGKGTAKAPAKSEARSNGKSGARKVKVKTA